MSNVIRIAACLHVSKSDAKHLRAWKWGTETTTDLAVAGHVYQGKGSVGSISMYAESKCNTLKAKVRYNACRR